MSENKISNDKWGYINKVITQLGERICFPNLIVFFDKIVFFLPNFKIVNFSSPLKESDTLNYISQLFRV